MKKHTFFKLEGDRAVACRRTNARALQEEGLSSTPAKALQGHPWLVAYSDWPCPRILRLINPE